MNIIKYITSRKYRFFARKLRDVEKSIWELDFKVAKSRQIREGIRQDRERCLENVARIKTMLNAENEGKKDVQVLSKLQVDSDTHEENAKRFEAQMKMIDEQINGVAAVGENPGQQGIRDTIQGLAELKGMYKEYLTQI